MLKMIKDYIILVEMLGLLQCEYMYDKFATEINYMVIALKSTNNILKGLLHKPLQQVQ
jgi:hypothetical protein